MATSINVFNLDLAILGKHARYKMNLQLPEVT